MNTGSVGVDDALSYRYPFRLNASRSLCLLYDLNKVASHKTACFF